ncbi:MAG TPA: flagellar hook-length control protein FliK [Acidimicrobiales bacterium]|nr:flagellar hook-length control protein FliK [Acidimicrobiales bacterium]
MSDVSATARAGHGSTEARAAGAFTPPDWLDVLSSGTGSIPATRPASHGAGPLAGPAGSAIDEHPGSEPVAATEVAAGLPTTATAAGGGATTTAAGDGATSQRSEVLLGAASEGGRGARGGSGEVATATVSAAAAAEGTPSRRAGLDDEPSTSDGRGTHGVVAAPSQPASISQPLSLLVPGTVSPPTAAASAGATAQADHTPDAPSRLDHIALASAISAPITASDGSHSLSALLTPPELGSVQASVRVDGTSVGVVLTASTDAGHRALSTNLAQLATALSHDGREVQVTLVERGDRGAGSGDGSGAGSGARDRSAAGGSDENGRRQNGNGNSTAQTASSGAGPGGGGRGGESNPTPSQHVAAQDGVADHAGPQSSLGGVAVDSSTRAVGDSLAADGSSHLDLVL